MREKWHPGEITASVSSFSFRPLLLMRFPPPFSPPLGEIIVERKITKYGPPFVT
jgi:hypothetical protein